MASMLGSNRRRHGTPKARPRRQSLQKPNGVIAPRVQKVGGAHFAIVCVDPAKHRSEWMMADYFGNLLIEPQTLQHQAPCFKLAVEQIRQAQQQHNIHDMIVVVERTANYYLPAKRAFAKAGFDTRVVHPFATKQYRLPADPGNKTDETDLYAQHRAAVAGFGLCEFELEPPYRQLQLRARHRRNLVENSEETGLNYHRNRYYNPAIGRWMSEDPIGFGGGDANLNRFVGNSPTNFIDPHGLLPAWWGAGEIAAWRARREAEMAALGDAGGPGGDWLDTAANFSAGWGDTLSFGIADGIRDLGGFNDGIDHDSPAYTAGEVTGVVHGIALTTAGGVRVGRGLRGPAGGGGGTAPPRAPTGGPPGGAPTAPPRGPELPSDLVDDVIGHDWGGGWWPPKGAAGDFPPGTWPKYPKPTWPTNNPRWPNWPPLN